MSPIFQPLKTVLCRQNFTHFIQHKLKLFSPQIISTHTPFSQNLNTETHPNQNLESNTYTKQLGVNFLTKNVDSDNHSVFMDHPTDSSMEKDAVTIQNVLKEHTNDSVPKLERALDQMGLSLMDEELVMQVLKRHRYDWKPALLFLKWVCKGRGVSGYVPGTEVYNEMLDILGRARRFEELGQVFEQMSTREGLINERTFSVILNRYASAHMVNEAIEFFYKRKEYGFELDLVAFQTLLLSLCRYKHVDIAETLFHSNKNELGLHIKTLNIILNGWCVLGSLPEAKRFWRDIIRSGCRPDLFTYGIMINSLSKKGKLGTAMKLFRSMWKKGIVPDVAISNSIINELCFKKRIPEAFELMEEMKDKGCHLNAATYNSLIKYLCKNRRMEKVYELLDEMEQKKGCGKPNDITFNYLLKSMKKPNEFPELLERMKRNGCEITCDTYTLMLKLCMDWDHAEGVEFVWNEMEKNGLGHDWRCYTIMIHGLHSKGKMEEAFSYYTEMVSKGMKEEPRTNILVNDMKIKLKDRENELRQEATSSGSAKCEQKDESENWSLLLYHFHSNKGIAEASQARGESPTPFDIPTQAPQVAAFSSVYISFILFAFFCGSI